MKYFVTADTHFGHKNIIKYCNRPYKSIDEMDQSLIRNWNNRVKPEDTVFFLGDFCFKASKEQNDNSILNNISEYYKSKLNGNIVFIKGNHDNKSSTKTHIKSLQLEYGGFKINCVHNPNDYDSKYEINFVGHIHQNWLIKKQNESILFNVGVDVHKFMPITIDEALREIAIIKKQEDVQLGSNDLNY